MVPGVEIVEVTGSDSLTTDPETNVAGVASSAVLRRLGIDTTQGVRIWLQKQMPLASGLGSSAASSVAGAVAVNELFGGLLSKEALIDCALEGEAVASGEAHADNVAPSLLGGIVLIRSYNPLDFVSLPVPLTLRVIVVYPHTNVETAAARHLVSEQRFQIGQVVHNLGNIAAFVSSLHSGDLALLGRSVNDALVEPIRAKLVPSFSEVKRVALENGALGCSISGSGPSVFAFAQSDTTAVSIGAAMQDAFQIAGLSSDSYIGSVNTKGAHVISAH
jgi:homoserine kinase